MDIGCYCISLARFLFDAEPNRVFGIIEKDPRFGTDRLTSGILDFSEGTSSFTSATQLNSYQRVNILGTDGRIEIEIPFNAPTNMPCKIWHQSGPDVTEIVLDICDQYTIQGDLFSQAIINNSDLPTSLEDAVNNMKVLDAIKASAIHGAWQNI